MNDATCSRTPTDADLFNNLEEIPSICPATQIGKAYKSVLRVFEEEFRDACVTPTQFSVLVHVGILNEPGGSELAQKLGSDPSTVSRILDTLEKKEFVSTRSGKDRRTQHYSLTDKGRSAVQDGLASWERARSRVLESVDQDNWNSALGVLDALRSVS